MVQPVVNVPPADLVKSFIDRALAAPQAQHPALIGLHPALRAASAEVADNIGAAERQTELDAARAVCREHDGAYDRAQSFVFYTLQGFMRHPDKALVDAARHVFATFFPEGLAAVTQASFEAQAALALTLEKRLAQAGVQGALTALSAELPKLSGYLTDVIGHALALGEALGAVDAFYVDKAGRASNPKLFAARARAHQLFATFVDVVETVAYPTESAEDAQARAALLGPYHRFLGATRSRPKATPEVAPTPTPEA